MLHHRRSGWAKRFALIVTCTAFLAGGTVLAADGGPDPDQVPADAGVSSAPSYTEGTKGPAAIATQPAVSSEPSSTATMGTGPTVSSGPSSTVPPRPAAKEGDIVESVHESLTYGFLSTATWLDSFFGNQRYEAEANDSQFRVDFVAFREDGTGMDYIKPVYTLRLVLPQLRKKTRIVIAGDPTVDTNATAAATPPVTAQAPEQPATTRNVGGALEYYPVETDRSNLSFRLGLKLHNGTLAGLIGPRYRYLIPLNPWAFRFTQEVTYSTEQRWQTRTTFDLERPLPGGLFFRATLEGVWTENINGFPYALGFTLREPLDPNRALLYSWINYFQTSPTNELLQETFVFGYRQRFWKPWLFLEIDPQVRFPRTNGFSYTPGILFRIELVFGKSSALF